jgi:uncharacterized protein
VKHPIRRALAVGMLSLSLFGQAMAGPLEDAFAAYQHGDFAAALQLLRPLAEQGDARAQNFLGVMYVKGNGVPRDYRRALSLFRRAAARDDAAAQLHLGEMYMLGHGVPRDDRQAIPWLRKAAEQENAGAQAFLGGMYVAGRGVPKDPVQAYVWLDLSTSRWAEGDSRNRMLTTQFRDLLATKMTADQIAKAQRLSAEWTAQHPGPPLPLEIQESIEFG